jgi:hypothetical protein
MVCLVSALSVHELTDEIAGTDIAYQATRRLLERERVAGRLLDLSRRLRCEGPVAAALEVLG